MKVPLWISWKNLTLGCLSSIDGVFLPLCFSFISFSSFHFFLVLLLFFLFFLFSFFISFFCLSFYSFVLFDFRKLCIISWICAHFVCQQILLINKERKKERNFDFSKRDFEISSFPIFILQEQKNWVFNNFCNLI